MRRVDSPHPHCPRTLPNVHTGSRGGVGYAHLLTSVLAGKRCELTLGRLTG